MKNRIKELRSERGMSQADLADAVGLTQGFVSHLEADRKPITLEQLVQFAEVFNVHPSDIIDDPRWNKIPSAELNEKLLIATLRPIIKAMLKHRQIPEETGAIASATLYKRFARTQKVGVEQLKLIGEAAEMLISHEMRKQA